MQALNPTLLCANCEYWRSDLSFPWRSEEASRAKGPTSLCHFCHDAGHKAPKVASGPRGHSNASNAPPANGALLLGIILVVIGVAAAFQGLQLLWWMTSGIMRVGWPVALIAAGVVIVLAARRGNQ